MIIQERARARAKRLRLWAVRTANRLIPSEAQRLFVLTVLLGGICGLAAVAFHLMIRLAERLMIARAMSAPGHSWIAATILTPTLGGVLAGVLLHWLPKARGSGIPEVKAAHAGRGDRVRLRDSFAKFVIASFQIGTGASLGREGPTVHICAGLATAVGQRFGVSQRNIRRLLPVGAAAGIAAAFNAPIAAVTFTVEEVVGTLDGTVLSGVIVAAALSAVVERSVLGEHPVFDVPAGYGLRDPRSLLIYALLGVVAAGVSLAFTKSLLSMRLRFRTMKLLPAWARPGVGGMITGVLAVIAFALLARGGVTGGGYETLGVALSGNLAFKALLLLGCLKVIATVASYASGGAGGIFAPSLFIGAMFGGALGYVDRAVFHHPADSVGAFALVGMGAVFSGVIRAPITSVLIIVEMTSGYSLILPLMIANMSAYIIARHFQPTPIYDALLEQDGIVIHSSPIHATLENKLLSDVILEGRPYLTFSQSMGTSEIIKRIVFPSRQEVFPLENANGTLAGLIAIEDLAIVASEPQLDRVVHAVDIMRPPVSVHLDDNLQTALELMTMTGLTELPVTDAQGHVRALLRESDIARAIIQPATERLRTPELTRMATKPVEHLSPSQPA